MSDKWASVTAEKERLAKRIEILQADNDKLLCDAIDNLIVKDENESLRKRCQQLERLVCSPYEVVKFRLSLIDRWRLWDNDADEEVNDVEYESLQAAIDAAIKHMEQEASE